MNGFVRSGLLVLLGMALAMPGHCAVTEQFDLARFAPSEGWKKQEGKDYVSFTRTDPASGGYCVIAVYRSVASQGSTDRDFDNEWRTLVTSRFPLQSEPRYESGLRPDGWQAKAGAAAIDDGSGGGIALLSVFSAKGRSVSVFTLMNREDYATDLDAFLDSLTLEQPTAESASVVAQQHADSPRSATGRISIATTHFDDGWTATIHPEWVQVSNGSTRVYLYHFFPVGEEMRPPNGNIRDNLWNRVVRQRFDVLSEDESRKTMINEWKEGEAIDRETGEQVYLAMSWTGGFYLAATPDRETSFRLFPSPDDLNNMTRYNKFAVAPGDLSGSWQSGGSQTAQWYDEVTGLHVGGTLAASSAVFRFAVDGTYSSVHNGATGAVVGGMNTFQQEYRGNYNASNWQLTLSNRYQGNTDSFDAHFQAVRGGRLLYLNNNRGENYLLVKTD